MGFNFNTARCERYILLAILIITWTILFGRNLLGIHYTGWDTHDLGFTFFLYFSDALHSGQIPFWNPFIQGGTFHAGLFNAGNYSLFQLIFLLLSQLINPVYAYELMIQIVILIGSAGFYLWLRSTCATRIASIFGAYAFFLSVLVPLVGQIMFLFSLATLPWMLLVCHRALAECAQIRPQYLVYAVLIASFMSSGYPWMNVMNFVISFLYGCSLYLHEKRGGGYRGVLVSPAVLNLTLFYLGSVVVIACYYIPGYYALKFYYSIFAGDYVSPEPRLRGLSPSGYFTYNNILEAFFSSIDLRSLKNNAASLADLPKWTWGTGWVVFLIVFHRKFDKSFIHKNILWIGMVVFWLLYSAGSLARLIPHLPLFNANRWWFIGQVYVSISLIALAVDQLRGYSKSKNICRSSFLIFVAISLGALVLLSAPLNQYLLVLCSSAVIYSLVPSSNPSTQARGLVLLMAVNMIAFISMPRLMPGALRSQQRVDSDPTQNYYQKIEQRVRNSLTVENTRRLGLAKDYIFNDDEWLIKKQPYSHGYNPLGNPLYWYLKDDDAMQRLVYVAQNVRLEKKILRSEFSSDNEFAEAMIHDVHADSEKPIVDEFLNSGTKTNIDFKWVIKDFELEPNQARIKLSLNDAAYIVFNNTYFPGWEVFVDGKRSKLISVNRIFQGVYVDKPGEFDVTFRFRPVYLLAIFCCPLIILMLSLLWLFRSEIKPKISGLL